MKLGDELPEDQQRVFKDLVRRYPDLFTDMPGETDVIQHQIRLTDDTPIRCKPYPLPYAMREELRNEVDTMLEMGVVRPWQEVLDEDRPYQRILADTCVTGRRAQDSFRDS